MFFKDMHPADIAEAISEMRRRERNLHFLKLSPELKVEVFSFLDINIQEEIVRSMTREDYADVLNNLEPDDRTELLENFPDELIKYSIPPNF